MAYEIIWVTPLLKEIRLELPTTPVIWSDTKSVVALFENPIQHSKMKHVAIDMFCVREKVHSREIIVNFVCATEQTIDILLKLITKKTFMPCRKTLGVFLIEEVKDHIASSTFYFTSR